MIPKATVECSGCSGRGLVPHARRLYGPPGEMVPDPWDQKSEDICERCGGTGKMIAPGPPDDPIASYGATGMC